MNPTALHVSPTQIRWPQIPVHVRTRIISTTSRHSSRRSAVRAAPGPELRALHGSAHARASESLETEAPSHLPKVTRLASGRADGTPAGGSEPRSQRSPAPPAMRGSDREEPTSPEHTAGPAPRSPSAFAVTVPLRSIFRRCFLITPSHEAAAPTDKLCVSASVPSTESRILSPALTRRQIPSLWGDGAPRRMRVPPGGAHAALTAAPLLA